MGMLEEGDLGKMVNKECRLTYLISVGNTPHFKGFTCELSQFLVCDMGSLVSSFVKRGQYDLHCRLF